MNTQELIAEWQQCKDFEKQAAERRREIEDELVKAFQIDATKEGVVTVKLDNTVIKVSPRLDKKVDADKLQDVAAENGLTGMLGQLFRWSADINSAVWKVTDPKITAALAPAITIKPGRPSFSITNKE